MDYRKQFEKETGYKPCRYELPHKGYDLLSDLVFHKALSRWLEKKLDEVTAKHQGLKETINETQHTRDMAECVADNRDMRKKLKRILEIIEVKNVK